MSEATFDTDTIRLMALFENKTHAGVRDCFSSRAGDCVYIIVEEGAAGAAIGRNGSNVKSIEGMIKKGVKIFEYSTDLKTFVKNVIPQASEINVLEEDGKKIVQIHVDAGSKAVVIGRDKKNLNLFKELLRRNHDVDDLIVR